MNIDRSMRTKSGVLAAGARAACSLFAFIVLMFGAVGVAQAQQARAATFDHMTTGYPLTGSHEDVRCESCHIKGILKGTPRDCATCHMPNNQRGAKAMSVNHIPITQTCDTCHTTTNFQSVLFTHVSVVAGTCATCHDNRRAQGRPANHVQLKTDPTGSRIARCDDCHLTSAFAPVRGVNHNDFNLDPNTGVACSACHDGRFASGRPSNHIPTLLANCQVCHTASLASFTSFAGGQMDHVADTKNCNTCHGASVANTFVGASIKSTSTTPPHVPLTSDKCEVCHASALPPAGMLIPASGPSSVTFTGGLMSHTGITTGCATCHGANVVAGTFIGVTPKTSAGLSPQHVPTTQACELCHSNAIPSMLIPAAGASGMSGTTFANAQFSHSGITSGCVACHGPTITSASFYGITKIIAMPATSPMGTSAHIPSSTACETCHSGSTPSGLIAPNSTKSVPGSLFATPIPTTAQIHTGMTGGCATCHETNFQWMGISNYPITRSSPYTGFQTRPQSAAGTYNVADAAHPSSGDCSACHGSFTDFTGVSKPANHIPTATAAQCTACHTSTDYSVMPTLASIHANAPSTTTNCTQCHGSSVAAGFAIPSANFTIKTTPTNHVPTSAACELCHVGSGTSIAALPVGNGATFANSAMSHSGITTGCTTCHGANIVAGTFAGVTPKTSAGLSPQHIPTSQACESCHGNAIPAMLIPPSGAAGVGGTTFGNAQFSHAGITAGCATCHGPTITGSSFYGITKIIAMPATTPVGASSHIPSSTSCETCHSGSIPAGLIAPNSSKSVPGSGFSTPLPTTTQVHTGVTSGCSACHDTNYVWVGMSSYPITRSTPFTGFQTRPQSTSGTFFVQDAAHPTTQDCSTCHASFTDFGNTQAKPANHIPTAASASCSACHTSSDYSVFPTLANIHANAPSTTTNCTQCHGPSVAAGFAIPAISFSIKTQPSGHVATGTASCEACHVGTNSSIAALPVPNGATFANSAFSHSTIGTTRCDACHDGTPNITGVTVKTRSSLTPSHVAYSGSTATGTGLDCSTCHTTPSMLIPVAGAASVGATTFNGGQYTHSGITSGCVACHASTVTGSTFYGISKIITMPATTPVGASSHIPSSTTCENCHTAPTGTIAGNSTKSVPGSSFATPVPTTTQIHTGITSGCSACHETNYVWMGMTNYPITTAAPFTGFQTRPQATAGTYFVKDTAHPTSGDCSACHGSFTDFSGVSKPANHIPTAATAQCTNCHTSTDYSVTPTLANIHAYAPSTTSNCAQCHGSSVAGGFAIPSIGFTVMTLPAAHIPTSASCEVCHVGTGSSITALPVANGATFANSRMSHSGITSNCAQCHGPTVGSFTGITSIIKMPATTPVGTTSHIPSSTTCENCHIGAVPSGLIPASATTTAPGTLFASPVPTTTQIHTGVSSGCSACHETNYVWMGMTNYPITTSSPFTGFQTRPQSTAGTYRVADAAHPTTGDCSNCHTGFTDFSSVAKPAGHIPTSLTTCSTCHIVSGNFSTSGLTTDMTAMHTGVTSGCISCHANGPFAGCATAGCTPSLSYQPLKMPLASGGTPTAPNVGTHIPVTGVACEGCHSTTNFSSFVITAASSKAMMNHTVVTAFTCISCHKYNYVWVGFTTAKHSPGAAIGQIVTQPSSGHESDRDCTTNGCHSTSSFNNRMTRPVVRAMARSIGARPIPEGVPSRGVSGVTGSFNHQGVSPAQCQSCHDGVSATGKPVKHLATSATCSTCHRTTAWVPAYFNHAGVAPNGCVVCHNGTSATGKPGSHFVTARSCDACHRTVGWVPVSYSHLSANYRPQPDKTTCVSCHVTNGELIPRLLRSPSRGRPTTP